MKRGQTKEEKPERSGTKEGPTGRLYSTLSMFVFLSVERVYWLKKIAIEKNMSQWWETDYSSDTDCQRDRGHVKLNVSES